MGKLVVTEFVSLDGVFQDPGGAGEIERGGWSFDFDRGQDGDKFKFEIPPNLAYGPNSPSPLIPPNSTLVFEVELLGIE